MFVFSAEPVFIVRPSAARVGLNGIAKFDCVARGNPPPSVFWTKEVRDHFSGLKSQKLWQYFVLIPTWLAAASVQQWLWQLTLPDPLLQQKGMTFPQVNYWFLNGQTRKVLPKNMSTDKHLQMLDVIADLDQLEFAEITEMK